MRTIDESRVQMLKEREESRYVAERPKSKALFERAKASLIGGVPVGWHRRWVEPFPIYVKEAKGAHLVDVDGHHYVDLCLGDSGALYGHSPAATVEAMINQMRTRGITLMLPIEDAIWVGEELARRFGLPYWQVYMTATDANRFAIRIARAVTKRDLVLVFHGCYHGSVDETMVTLKDGATVRRSPNTWRLPDPSSTSRVIEFNDIDALEAALSPQDVACVMCEPAMTNIHVGIAYPEPGYHDALREITRRYGTLLIIDETHTIPAGPGGLTREMNLDPDIFTLGKPIAGGMPAAVIGLSQKVAEEFTVGEEWRSIGGTLSANALAVAAVKANLENVMTPAAYDHSISLAERLADGSSKIIKDADLPWCVTRLGFRMEYGFHPAPYKNGAQEIHDVNSELGKLFHLYLINHGILMSPFHNITLTCPEATVEDVDFYNKVFGEFVNELIG